MTDVYYKGRQVLQSASGITKCEILLLESASSITKCDRLLFQSVAVITKWDVTAEARYYDQSKALLQYNSFSFLLEVVVHVKLI